MTHNLILNYGLYRKMEIYVSGECWLNMRAAIAILPIVKDKEWVEKLEF
jgi:hypothetical protein